MQQRPPIDFNIQLTPLTKKLLIGIIVAYVLELIIGQAVISLNAFAWFPDEKFRIWQPVTHFFVLDIAPNFSPLRFLLSLLGIVFFMPPVEQSFRKKGLGRLLALTIGISIAFGALCSVTSIALQGVAYGIESYIVALLTVFCFLRPSAQILLFFILPIKAEWIGWFTGLISFLYLLANRDLGAAMQMAGWISGLVFLAQKRKGPLKKLYKQTIGKPRAAKNPFKIIQGGKDDGDIFH